MKFKVQTAIFAKFPGVRIGVVVVLGMDNTKGGKEIIRLLREEEKKQNATLVNADFNLIPETAGWKDIYRQFGSNPRDFRPSVEALLRRVRTGNPLPSINPLVDVYNLLSIRHFLPAGAEDLDKVVGDIELGFAKGTEKGKYIGSDEVSVCDVGEVVYRDQVGFICRKWNWREGDRTKIDEQTKNVVVVFEALPAVSDKVLEAAMAEADALIKEYLSDLSNLGNLEIKTKILSDLDTEYEIDFESGKKAIDQEDMDDKETEQKIMQTYNKVVFRPAENPLAKIDIRSDLVKGLSKTLAQAVIKVSGEVDEKDIVWEHPKNESWGDYSTNLALKIKDQRSKIKDINQKSKLGNPVDIARELVDEWRKGSLPEEIDRVEIAGVGFINIWLTKEYLVKQASSVLTGKESYGSTKIMANKKILLEHTSPNPQTTIMLGHLRNNFLGMTTARLLENAGAEVKLDCIVNDRGVHLCRSMWGYLVFANKKDGFNEDELTKFKEVVDGRIQEIAFARGGLAGMQGEALQIDWQNLLEKWVNNSTDWYTPEELGQKTDHANLIWYVLGSRAYKEIIGVEAQVDEILKAWEAEDKNVRKLWKTIIGWSEAGYAQTYQKVGSRHDHYWHESDHWQEGKDIVEKGLDKGVFVKSEGAVVTNLSQFGLSDTVVIKSDGTGLYMTQDLALTRLKMEKFKADLYIWDIGAEQTLYFQQLFKVVEQLGMAKADQLYHLGYALINFKGGGKMATRKGDVVMADEVLDLLHQRVLEIIKTSDQGKRGRLEARDIEAIAEDTALGALKYSLLKYGRETTMQFDIDESLALEGNSAPYIQYAYARAGSVLEKAGRGQEESEVSPSSTQVQFQAYSQATETSLRQGRRVSEVSQGDKETGDSEKSMKIIVLGDLAVEEVALLRTIYRFPEVVLEATTGFAPNLICNYLYDIAQRFNLFYDKQKIIGSANEQFRLALTKAIKQILANGLTLLGIATPERM